MNHFYFIAAGTGRKFFCLLVYWRPCLINKVLCSFDLFLDLSPYFCHRNVMMLIQLQRVIISERWAEIWGYFLITNHKFWWNLTCYIKERRLINFQHENWWNEMDILWYAVLELDFLDWVHFQQTSGIQHSVCYNTCWAAEQSIRSTSTFLTLASHQCS